MTTNIGYTPDIETKVNPGDQQSSSDPASSVSSSTKIIGSSGMKITFTQIFVVFILIFGLGIGIIIGYFALHPAVTKKCKRQQPTCPGKMEPKITMNSQDKGIFEILTSGEMTQVCEYMTTQGLLSGGETPSLRDNYVYGMSLDMPRKRDALGYLDEGRPSPGRYARVHVHRGNRSSPDLMEYKVGPLGGSLTARALYRDGELPYNSRPRDGIEWECITEQVSQAMAILRPLLQESFDGAYYGGGITFHPQAPPGLEPNERQTRFVMALVVEGTARGRDLHPLPLTGTVYNPGVDTSRWYTHSFYYLNQGPFATAQSLLDSYRNNLIIKFVLPTGHRQSLFAATFPKQNSEKPRTFATTKAPPRSYHPSGPRFTIEDHRIKWMGWDFTIGASQFRGPGLYNVKFKDERIVYENSMNDVALIYASDASSGANTIYMDATFGLGEFQDIILGVDCPDHATILEATWFNSYKQAPVTAKTICVFESVGEQPLWRRRDKFAAGLANHFLTVRTPMSVGNYDYTIDFIFHLDGLMKTEGVATGFLQTSFWNPNNAHAGADKATDPFGYRVAEFTHGALHDHTFGFKVDLDILGTDNSFDVIHWKAGDVVEALVTQTTVEEKPPYFLYNETRYVEWETLQTEAGLKIDLQTPKFWTVVNDDEKNKWGAKRGYRIIPETMVSQVVPDSHPAMDAISYTKYHCMVTRHKNEEQYLTGSYDLNRLADPMVSMDKMLNNENIVNTDLVTWVTFGFLHVPTSEDVPMTVRAHSSFFLKPFNYFDTTASFDMPQYVDTADGSIRERPPPAAPCVEDIPSDCYFCD